MIERVTLEGAILELDASLDSLDKGEVDFESFVSRVENLRDRLKKLLDMTPPN